MCLAFTAGEGPCCCGRREGGEGAQAEEVLCWEPAGEPLGGLGVSGALSRLFLPVWQAVPWELQGRTQDIVPVQCALCHPSGWHSGQWGPSGLLQQVVPGAQGQQRVFHPSLQFASPLLEFYWLMFKDGCIKMEGD